WKRTRPRVWGEGRGMEEDASTHLGREGGEEEDASNAGARKRREEEDASNVGSEESRLGAAACSPRVTKAGASWSEPVDPAVPGPFTGSHRCRAAFLGATRSTRRPSRISSGARRWIQTMRGAADHSALAPRKIEATASLSRRKTVPPYAEPTTRASGWLISSSRSLA